VTLRQGPPWLRLSSPRLVESVETVRLVELVETTCLNPLSYL